MDTNCAGQRFPLSSLGKGNLHLGPPVLLGDKLHLSELHSPHTACTDIPHLTHLDEVVQRLHSLFNRYVCIEAVNLEEVDILEI